MNMWILKKTSNFPLFIDIKWMQMLSRHKNDQYQCLCIVIVAIGCIYCKKDSGSFGSVVTSKQWHGGW